MATAIAATRRCGVASVTAKPALSAVSLLASARFLLTGIYQIHGGTAWEHAPGWVGLPLTAAAFYLAFALSHLGDHVAAVEREAGVRGQL